MAGSLVSVALPTKPMNRKLRAKNANEPTLDFYASDPAASPARRLSAFESLRRTAKALPRAEDLVETALITAETYESRETALRSSIEESKARLAAFVARREAARETRGALAETKKTSFAEWREIGRAHV